MYTCPCCNRSMIKKTGKFGEFFGCVAFPACRGSRSLDGTCSGPQKPVDCLAQEIRPGEWFRKRGGKYVFLRMAESSVRFYKMDESFIYGTCFNGNTARVPKDKLVCRATALDYVQNIRDSTACEEQPVGIDLNEE